MWAGTKKDLNMVKTLVNGGAQLLKPKKDGMTLLHLSATHNDIHILDYCLKKKETTSIDLETNDVIKKFELKKFLGVDTSPFGSIFGKYGCFEPLD